MNDAKRIFRLIFGVFIVCNIALFAFGLFPKKSKEQTTNEFINDKIKVYFDSVDSEDHKHSSIEITYSGSNDNTLKRLLHSSTSWDTSRAVITPHLKSDSVQMEKYLAQINDSSKRQVLIGKTSYLKDPSNNYKSGYRIKLPYTKNQNYEFFSLKDGASRPVKLEAVSKNTETNQFAKQEIFNLKNKDEGFKPIESFIPMTGTLNFFGQYHEIIFCLISIILMSTSYIFLVNNIIISEFLGSLKILNVASQGFCATPLVIKSKVISVNFPASEFPFIAGLATICFVILFASFVLYLAAKNFRTNHDERSKLDAALLKQKRIYKFSLFFTMLGCSTIVFYACEILYLLF